MEIISVDAAISQTSISNSTTASAQFAIPRDDLPLLQTKALLGSSDAAQRLSSYFGFLVLDQREANYWLRIAAENDGITAQYNLGLHLSDSNDEKDKSRACFWLMKARERATPEVKTLASDLLRKLGDRCRTK